MGERPRFIEFLEKNGVRASVVSIRHLDELGGEIRELHDKGLLDDLIFNYTGTKNPFHSPHLPRTLPGAKSIIIVAMPQPIIRTTFHTSGRIVQLFVPPTYYDAIKVTRQTRSLLREAFRLKPYKFIRANLPLKLLAVRSGLAVYGRNNITYVPGMGSFYRLMAFYSDYESPVDYWQEKKSLPLCDKCKACTNACPTGAIGKDRFLVRAETCLTYMNEQKSDTKFPASVKSSAHNALIGCLRCQRVCPYNKKVADWFEDRGEFNKDETAYLMKGRFSGKKAARLEKRLNRLGLDLTTFPRNLKVLLKSSG